MLARRLAATLYDVYQPRCQQRLVLPAVTKLCVQNHQVHFSSCDSDSIPRDKIKIKFVRSGGPGGQNVNKLNTKAFIKFHVASADWLSDRVKTRLQEMFSSRINQAGEISVTSDKFRKQHHNLDDAMAKLSSLIEQAGEEPGQPSAATIARVKALKRKAERLRRTAKKYHSDKKQDRSV